MKSFPSGIVIFAFQGDGILAHGLPSSYGKISDFNLVIKHLQEFWRFNFLLSLAFFFFSFSFTCCVASFPV